jgi:hypothetical protein
MANPVAFKFLIPESEAKEEFVVTLISLGSRTATG